MPFNSMAQFRRAHQPVNNAKSLKRTQRAVVSNYYKLCKMLWKEKMFTLNIKTSLFSSLREPDNKVIYNKQYLNIFKGPGE